MNDIARNTPSLPQIAARISVITQTMDKNAIDGALLLGEQFYLARDMFPSISTHRAGWHDWIKQKTPWNAAHAIGFIRMYERTCEDPEVWSAHSPEQPGIPLTVMMRLASPKLPYDERRALIDRIYAEKLTKEDVTAILKARRDGQIYKTKPKRHKRGRPQFINAVRTACQLCETAQELPIPFLSQDELTALITELEEAKGYLGHLLSELKGDLK